MGKEIGLELDHIDGNENNADLSNLRWLCPNCHAITDTYAGKNIKLLFRGKIDKNKKEVETEKKKTYCFCCGKEIHNSKSGLCKECYKMTLRRINRPNKEQLKKLIRAESFLQIGKQYSVSDNAIRKWCIYYNLPFKKKEIKSYTDEEWNKI